MVQIILSKNICTHLFENGEKIDVVLLACTHYPLLKEKIEEYMPVGVKLVSQGEIVAKKLERLSGASSGDGRKMQPGRKAGVLYNG